MSADKLPLKVEKGQGQTLVLLHGLGNNYKSWTYLLEKIDLKRFRVLVPDLLGFGDAPKPDVAYTVQDHANAVIDMLDQQGITDAFIAGHSMGCLVAIEVAHKRPDLAKQLILLGAPLFKRMPKRRSWKKFLHVEGTYFTIFNLLKDNPELTITAAKSADTLLPFLHGMEITEETWVPFRRSLTKTIMQTDSYHTVSALKVPTLMVYGVLDFFVSKSNLKKAARKNRQYVKVATMMGPHEITPFQGKRIARVLKKLLKKRSK
jgi:pimeloyl-ACP methyl ester carboxylesterase